MCVVSYVGDNYRDTFPERWPRWVPSIPVNPTTIPINPTTIPSVPDVSREEFEALKKEIEELRILLLAAKRFDEATGQKDCEMDEKVALIKQIAELVGVKMDDVFGDQSSST